ncbi:hypothetical protein EJ08DRAFT_646604 [Tothia fuscella]|uniref:Uncharacterized protein n=1 Tax=Tothia fuscella TaxID=1048955 RepID=A0A9P4U1S7_9PEZI|nr:hypothetical protein EJ08DRAFT_646604 [Tothia fuscella]
MQRTNTTNTATFDLPLPEKATFVFKSSPPSSPNTIHITISPSGTWRMPYHWHPSETANTTVAACQRVTCLSGYLHVYVASGISSNYDELGFEGMTVNFAPGERISWDLSETGTDHQQVPPTAELVADHTLWRNYCGAILDKDIFPQLASTPTSLKVLFAFLDFLPLWRTKLLNLMLSIQLQAIFFTHDFHVYHGYIPVTWPWISQPFGGRPPAWAKRLQLQSMVLMARTVMMTAYYTGTLFLGMKGDYPEYTPPRNRRDDKK